MIDTAEEGYSGIIQEWLDKPVSLAVLMSVSEDNMGFEDLAANKDQMVIRTQFCLMEIWVECLGRDKGNIPTTELNLISRAIQRLPGWEKLGQRRIRGYGPVHSYGRIGFEHSIKKRDGKYISKNRFVPVEEFNKSDSEGDEGDEDDDDFLDLI